MKHIALRIVLIFALASIFPTQLRASERNGFFTSVRGREEVDCDEIKSGGRAMAALVIGQSNAANAGRGRHASKKAVYNFFNGKCYKARDPMLGASGDQGSVWTRLGDKLIEAGMYDRVVFVVVAAGGTSVRHWVPGSEMNNRMLSAVEQLGKTNITITHVLWHQGEADMKTGTTAAQYKRDFLRMAAGMRKHGIDAPIYVSVATICRSRPDGELQRAQKELVSDSLKIFPGPDTDSISSRLYRRDGCHFSKTGLNKAAELWMNALKSRSQ